MMRTQWHRAWLLEYRPVPGRPGWLHRLAPAWRSVLSKAQWFCLAAVLLGLTLSAQAIDPPHTNDCKSCHMPHNAPGLDLGSVAGNENLCISCHVPGGTASAKPFASSDQALPWPGSGTNSSQGTSHRWDSGLAGHVSFLGGAAVPSTGTVLSGGVYTGAYAKTYTISITSPGEAGTARFTWITGAPNSGVGINILTATNVLMKDGLSVTFKNGPSNSFQLNDRWTLYVRSDLCQPTNAALLPYLNGGTIVCSTCHDEHSQTNAPFDPNAPAYAGAGAGAGRHFLRISNDVDQMCVGCHAPRNVTNSLAGSHPVGVPTITNLFYKGTTNLVLEKGAGNIRCLTCHKIHYAPINDGDLLCMTNATALCLECHTLANLAAPAAHFNSTNNLSLWPGAQYGSIFPQRTNLSDRGSCVNCHHPHGWPDATNTLSHYGKLLVEREENLCYTCHDANGPALKNVKDSFSKPIRHPLANNDALRRAGRSVECWDCHNTHRAMEGSHVYTNTATAARNLISKPLTNVAGVAVNYTGLGNFAAPGTNLYTFIPKEIGATNEYQICFRCHAGYAWLPGNPPNGISANGSSTAPVETDQAQEFSPMNRSGHPIITGLNNYPNSLAPKALTAAAMKAPWNVNLGTQTMMCSDCHSDTTAAQGPHGSAAQFMLRGTNVNGWPNVQASAWNTSWCANCHNRTQNNIHGGNHNGRRCYECHIVIPHGGKLSRLMADHDAMPARYAYNGARTTQSMQAFTKASSYSESNCRAQCSGNHSGRNPNENW